MLEGEVARRPLVEMPPLTSAAAEAGEAARQQVVVVDQASAW